MRYAYLLRTVPLLPVPLLIQQKLIVVVGDNSWGESPRTIETTAISVATTKSMSTTQGYDFLVIESHAAKDSPQVLVTLGGIWETSIRCASRSFLVLTTWSERNDWALHLLDRADTSQDPEIRVRDPWVLSCQSVNTKSQMCFMCVERGE